MILNLLRVSFRIKLTNCPTANLPLHALRATFKGTCDGVKSGLTARKLATNSLYSQKTLTRWMKSVVFGLRFAVSKIIDVTTTIRNKRARLLFWRRAFFYLLKHGRLRLNTQSVFGFHLKESSRVPPAFLRVQLRD